MSAARTPAWRCGLEADLEARHAHQLAAAELLGAGRPSGAYDVVIDAAGSASSLARAAEAAVPGGRILPLGVYLETMPVPGSAVSQVKELTYVNSIAYGRHNGVREVEQVASTLAAEPEIAKSLITHRFSIEDAREAFRVAADRQAGAIKVVIEPGQTTRSRTTARGPRPPTHRGQAHRTVRRQRGRCQR